MTERQHIEPSVSKKYKVSWVPSVSVITKSLGERPPSFKVEVTNTEDPLGKKWFVSIYPGEHSRVENKLVFKGHCWDRAEYCPIQWGWVALDQDATEKGEIQL